MLFNKLLFLTVRVSGNLKNMIFIYEKNSLAPSEDTIPYDDYKFLKYVNIKSWSSLYYQLFEIMSIKDEANSILEIGVGTGILGIVLKGLGFSYTSMDINPNLHPDYIGSVVKMPFPDKSYDIVSCFEVLEHLPYDIFNDSLSELFRVAYKAVIISLPNAKKMIPFHFCIPKLIHKKILIPLPFYNPDTFNTDPAHYWEINRKKNNIRQFKETLKKVALKKGFTLNKEYRVWENSYHHFFIFLKNDDMPPPEIRRCVIFFLEEKYYAA